MKFSDWLYDNFESIMGIIAIILGFVFIYVAVYIPERNRQEIRKMIIKDSSEYTQYEECIDIEDLFYCK